MKILAFNIVAILLIILAGFMVYTNKPNYGWVIFAAMLCMGTNYSEKKNDKT